MNDAFRNHLCLIDEEVNKVAELMDLTSIREFRVFHKNGHKVFEVIADKDKNSEYAITVLRLVWVRAGWVSRTMPQDGSEMYPVVFKDVAFDLKATSFPHALIDSARRQVEKEWETNTDNGTIPANREPKIRV